MAKRSSGKFKRMKNDFYPTPLSAVVPLISHLPSEKFTYAEPCAGNGALVKHLTQLTDGRGYATDIVDIEPLSDFVCQGDALEYTATNDTDYIITNPPWSRPLLHP